MEDQKELVKRLKMLEKEHRELDRVIEILADTGDVGMLELQRMKKKKLWLKDQIAIVRSKVIPDIIA